MPDAFWHVTSRDGLPTKEGLKLYIYRPAARMAIAFYRGGTWWDRSGEQEIMAPYCWANLDDLPPAPAER